MKGLENIKNFSLFSNSKITCKKVLKYYVIYSEVKEPCLCLTATVLEAPFLSTPSSQPNTQGCPYRLHATKAKTKVQNLWLYQKTVVSPPSKHM